MSDLSWDYNSAWQTINGMISDFEGMKEIGTEDSIKIDQVWDDWDECDNKFELSAIHKAGTNIWTYCLIYRLMAVSDLSWEYNEAPQTIEGIILPEFGEMKHSDFGPGRA